MQLRSGRSVNMCVKVLAPIPVSAPSPLPTPVPIYKPTPRDLVSSYKPISPDEHIVRYIFTLLDKYHNLVKENLDIYEKLCADSACSEDYLKNAEYSTIIENSRIRTEMLSIVNENFDIISATLPPFMLYGMVIDVRVMYDKLSIYKNEISDTAAKQNMNVSVEEFNRALDIFLEEIDKFDEQFTEFIVGSYAQSHIYTF